MTILDRIIENKRSDVAAAKRKISVLELQNKASYARKTISITNAVIGGSGIIAEFKRKSPSKGVINNDSDVLDVVAQYEQYGASAASVLTDLTFFGGSANDIESIRNSVKIPILRKDFMINEYQFYEAKSIGADAVLLIAACLTPAQTQEFAALAKEIGLEVLLEVHTEEELGHYCADVDLVGINNRNLKDFKVDLSHSVQLKNLLPNDAVSVAESGIYNVDDFKFLKKHGFQGFLMGEYFMRHQDPGTAFGDFIKNIAT